MTPPRARWWIRSIAPDAKGIDVLPPYMTLRVLLEWAGSVGHLWRTTGDITSCWDCIDTHGGKYNSWGVMYILDMQDSLRKYAGPGHWNDPDRLEV